MGNLGVLDAGGATVNLSVTGSGSVAAPFIPVHTVASPVDVNLLAGTNNVGDFDCLTLVGDNADLDSGAGVDNHAVIAWGLPASGGHVIGGTSANPIRIDPVGSTIQKVSLASWFLGADVVASVIGNPAVIATVAGFPQVIASLSGMGIVHGPAAHDAVATGNPVLNGAFAANAFPTPAANADVVRMLADLTGAMITRPYAMPENYVSGTLKGTGATTAQVLINAQGSGYRIYVTDWQVTNPSGSGGTDVCLHDGAATLAAGHATGSGGGFNFGFLTPKVGAVNGTLSVIAAQASMPILVNVGGYKGV